MNNFKAGFYKQQIEYKSFLPNKINHEFIIDDKDILLLLEKAVLYLKGQNLTKKRAVFSGKLL